MLGANRVLEDSLRPVEGLLGLGRAARPPQRGGEVVQGRGQLRVRRAQSPLLDGTARRYMGTATSNSPRRWWMAARLLSVTATS